MAATLNIALQGTAVFLMSPFASETIGRVLHSLTGRLNLEDYIGHDCYVVAASAIVHNALGRLQEDSAMQEAFKQYVERPATLCIPLLLATFSVGNGAAIYRPDFFQVPTDFSLSTYWLLLCSMLIYLLIDGSRTLLILRRGPARGGSRPTRHRCRYWRAAIWCGLFAYRCGARFAPASAHSWRIRTKWFTRASH